MDRGPDRCTGRSWVLLPSGTQTFSLSHASDIQNIVSFLYKKEYVVTIRVKLFSLFVKTIVNGKRHRNIGQQGNAYLLLNRYES